jgi:hypothetical protein
LKLKKKFFFGVYKKFTFVALPKLLGEFPLFLFRFSVTPGIGNRTFLPFRLYVRWMRVERQAPAASSIKADILWRRIMQVK